MNKHIKGKQGNAILNHNEIPLHTYQNGKILSLTILSIRKKGVSYAVDGILNWANLLKKWLYLGKLKLCTPCDPEIQLRIQPRKTCACVHRISECFW